MIVAREDIQKELGLPRFLSPLVSGIFSFGKFRQVNELYKKYESVHGWKFAETVLRHQHISINYDQQQLEKAKAYKSIIIISNHPHGILDGLLLLKLFGENGIDDIKVVANAMLEPVRTLSDNLVVVNSFDNSTDYALRFKGGKNVLKAIEQNNHIAFFPSADVSSFKLKSWRIEDPSWNKSFFRLIGRTERNILPVYISGRNSMLYQMMELIHRKLSLLCLIREFLNKKNEVIDIRIGEVFSTKNIDKKELPLVLRQKVYELGNAS